MELEITRFYFESAPTDYAASAAEIGASAGADTWRAACDDAPDYPEFAQPDVIDAWREYIRSWGAWDAEEIGAFTDLECAALMLQTFAGNMREGGLTPNAGPVDWRGYERDASDGQCSGSIYRGDDGSVYYWIGV